MARRRRRDRVVGRSAATGGLFSPSVSLPRSTYRDVVERSSTYRSDAATSVAASDVTRLYSARPLRPLLYSSVPVSIRSAAPRAQRRRADSLYSLRRSRSFPVDDLPYRIKFCVDRKQRREVLFAYGKAGFAGSGRGRWNGFRRYYRRSAASGYAC